jgi:TPR repeat protein
VKIIALVFSCLLVLSSSADASDADTFKAMVALANTGHAEAQYHVGMMHNNGIGTEQDPRQAFAWFQKAAASNDPLGAYKLGCYYDGQGAGIVQQDAAEALKYKLVAAKAGYALAQHDVATLYDKQGNSEEALKWWKAAGDQGYPRALFSLSLAHSAGKGTPRDMSLSYAYFKLSKLAPKKNVDEMASMLSRPDVEKAEKLVSEWRAQPTELTLKAKTGFSAAEELLKTEAKQRSSGRS